MSTDFIAKPGETCTLAAYPARQKHFRSKKTAQNRIKKEAETISDLSHALYAQATQSVLIVLQGMDTSGKDGTIGAMFSRTPPLNVRVEAFKKPSKDELAHDYLWRVHKACPPKGNITIFNRSHYEDVLVVKVRKFAPESAIEQRYDQINAFEKHLSQNGTKILKFMLNVSKDQQAIRLRERLVEPHKFWKFNPADLEDRQLWPEFMGAYETMIERTSTLHAPWHIIPSDSRSTRGAIVSSIVRQALQDMAPTYPAAAFGPDDFLIE
ncbi:MAG: polyphosphate kinase [Robiginitomaculum sp.]|nr:MAG: polyphosphate kinase [Robiginitomaculum sp.]